MKNPKYIVSMTLIATLLSTPASFANFDKEDNIISAENRSLSFYKKKQVCINDSFTIEMKKIDENSEFFKANIAYPLLKIKDKYINKDGYNDEIIENINKEVSTYILKYRDKIKTESEEYKKQYQDILSKSGEEYIKYQYEVDADYQVTYNKENLISIPIKTYDFTGGAHGMSHIKSYNYDLLSGRELKLKDMFKCDVNYKKVVDSFIKKEIEEKQDIYFNGEEGFKGINDKQEFYIDDDGIVIYFQLYEIAPYYVGIPKFKMIWKEFDKYLK